MKSSPVKKIETFLFLTGFVSILGQIVLLRELNIAFRGIELVYTLAFGAWLIGTAVGALLGKRNYVPPDNRIIILFLLTGILFPIDLFFIRIITILFGGVTGAYLPFGKQIISMFAALLPISILAGVLFQWTARRYIAADKTLARAYAIESLGGLTGGAASSLLIMNALASLLFANEKSNPLIKVPWLFHALFVINIEAKDVKVEGV